MDKNNLGSNRYKSIALYFDKNSKEDMDIYHFLTVSPRKKTNFIIRLITKYLHDNGVVDIGSITKEKAEYFIRMSLFDSKNVAPVAPSSSFSAEELIKLLAAFVNVSGTTSIPYMQTQIDRFSVPVSGNEELKHEKGNSGFEKKGISQQQEIIQEDQHTKENIMDTNAANTGINDQDELNDEDGLLGNWREGLEAFY